MQSRGVRKRVSKLSDLLPLEHDVIRLTAEGYTVKQIAQETNYSTSYISHFFDRNHESCFYHRIYEVKNKSQLITWYGVMTASEQLLGHIPPPPLIAHAINNVSDNCLASKLLAAFLLTLSNM